jgi:hypothetical protein
MIDNIFRQPIYDRKLESETVLEYIARYVKTNRFRERYRDRPTSRKPSKFFSYKISLDILMAILFTAAIVFFIAAIFTSETLPLVSFCLVLLSLSLFFIALIKSIFYFYGELQSIGKQAKNNSFVRRVNSFNLSYYEILIEGLSAQYSSEELKKAEMTLFLLIREKRSVDRMFIRFTKIIAIFLVVIIYAASYKIELSNNLIEYIRQITDAMVEMLYLRTRELIGLIVLIAIVLNILLKKLSNKVEKKKLKCSKYLIEALDYYDRKIIK